MGHRDLLVTHNLSEGKTHEPRPYLRGSVRRASGFVVCWACSVTRRWKSSGRPDGGEGL